MIPILRNHDPREIIGTFKDGVVTLLVPMAQAVLFNVFGNCGIHAIESETRDGIVYVKKFRVLEWSTGT